MINKLDFKLNFPFEQRIIESNRIKQLHPDKIPVICERSIYAGNDCPSIKKRKYLISKDVTIAHLIFILRKGLNIDSTKGLYLFVDGNILSCSYTIQNVYDIYKDEDEFLYIAYMFENTFG
jgi:GABA(A) receptor-associated protein